MGEETKVTKETLEKELAGLKTKALKKDGEPRADARAEDLTRIEAIQKVLAETEAGTPDSAEVQAERQKDADTGADKTIQTSDAEVRAAQLETENATLREQLKRAQEPKGIPIAGSNMTIGEMPRVESKMKDSLAVALAKRGRPLNEQEIISVEREIRRFVKRGQLDKDGKLINGGFVKGITEAQKKRVNELIALRVGAKGKDGLCWDINIVVPGFRV